jgi:hypothetical protein
MELSEMQRLKQLEDENRRLKQIVAERRRWISRRSRRWSQKNGEPHRLRAIEKDIATTQQQLIDAPSSPVSVASTPVTSPPAATDVPGRIPVFAMPIPQVLTQRVGLQTVLLNPIQVTASVAGVEVGGLFSWLQRQLANRRTLRVFALREEAEGACQW